MNEVDVQVTGVVPRDRRWKRWLSQHTGQLLRSLPITGVKVSVALVRDPAIRALNRQWRGKDTATDVLSFPLGEAVGPAARCLGDIIISLDTAKRQAKAHGETLPAELRRYLAHGLLHLMGYDHQAPKQARQMEREERRLLGHAGLLTSSPELAFTAGRRLKRSGS